MAGLESRLADVEQRLDGFDSAQISQPAFSARRDRHVHIEEESVNRIPGLVTVDEVNTQDATAQDSTDGMGALVFTDEEYSGFFGEHVEALMPSLRDGRA